MSVLLSPLFVANALYFHPNHTFVPSGQDILARQTEHSPWEQVTSLSLTPTIFGTSEHFILNVCTQTSSFSHQFWLNSSASVFQITPPSSGVPHPLFSHYPQPPSHLCSPNHVQLLHPLLDLYHLSIEQTHHLIQMMSPELTTAEVHTWTRPLSIQLTPHWPDLHEDPKFDFNLYNVHPPVSTDRSPLPTSPDFYFFAPAPLHSLPPYCSHFAGTILLSTLLPLLPQLAPQWTPVCVELSSTDDSFSLAPYPTPSSPLTPSEIDIKRATTALLLRSANLPHHRDLHEVPPPLLNLEPTTPVTSPLIWLQALTKNHSKPLNEQLTTTLQLLNNYATATAYNQISC